MGKGTGTEFKHHLISLMKLPEPDARGANHFPFNCIIMAHHSRSNHKHIIVR